MNILILDDEVYLAQKVEARLQEDGHTIKRLTTIKDIDYSIHYDTILLSTNLTGDIERVITKYSSSVVILLVTYLSEATVTRPIEAGASDYVLKPFTMDELLRKIKHFEQFNILQKENVKIKNYLNFIFNNIEIDETLPNKLPFLIETNEQKIADKIVYEVAEKFGKYIEFISLKKFIKINPQDYTDKILYLYDFHHLKQSSKKLIIDMCEDYNIIISSGEREEVPFAKITLMKDNQISTIESILTVNDYVKQITLNFQSKYPDTELSKRLGISRKSLWEKRKKFGIEKKKAK